MAEPVNIILRRKPKKRLLITNAATQTQSAAAAFQAAAQQKASALQKVLSEFVPSDVKAPVFEGRRFVFMLNRRIPAPGDDELAARSFGVAHEIHSLFQEAGLGAEVTAQFWNSTGQLQTAEIGTVDAYKHVRAGFNFDAVAEQIAQDSQSETEKGKNYIIAANGDFAGDIEALAQKFALLKHNPTATVDFIVYSEYGVHTKMEDLLKRLEEVAGPQIRKQVDMATGLASIPDHFARTMKDTLRARVVPDRGGRGQIFSDPLQGPVPPIRPAKKRWF